MTSLPARPHTALLVIDVQNAVVATAHARDQVIGTIRGLVERARAERVPVIWIQHSSPALVRGTPGWEYVPELVRGESEPLVHKTYGDSFEDTDLADLLAGLDVGRVVVTGALTDACIRNTLHGAFVRGYDVTLVADGHTTVDRTGLGAPTPDLVITHTNLYWGRQTAPGRRGETIRASEVDFAAMSCAPST